MAKQTFTSGQVLTAQQMNDLQTNDFNMSVSTQTANYTLVAADKGTREVMNMATAGTVTVPNSTFNAGDAVWLHSIGSGTITVAAGAGLTLNSSAGTAPTLAQWEGGVVYFTSASAAIFFRGGGTTYGVATGGSSSTISVGSPAVSYTLLTMTTDTNLVVSKAGLFDVLIVGGGGGGGGATTSSGNGGGGGGGGILGLDQMLTVYLAAGTYTVDVGAGGTGGNSYNNAGSPSLIGQSLIAYGGGRGASYAQTTSALETADTGTLFRVGGAGANSGGHSTTSSYRDATVFSNGFRRIGMGVVNNTFEGGAGRNDMSAAESSGAGGGGGAGGAGGAAATNTGGAGGNGRDISSWIGGSTYFAGAGGGGAGTSTAGAAGSGGVAGVTSGTGNNGVNYGAAGGGARNGAGGNGAAGAVFVRFR